MKFLSPILNTVLVCAAVFSLAKPEPIKTQAEVLQPTVLNQDSLVCDSGRSVHVSGTAVVNVPPDRALLQLGIQSNGKTPTSVEQANAVAIQRVIRAIESLGVESKDIVTDRYIVSPVYETYDSLYIKGYRIDNLVAVTLRDVDSVSDVVVAALEAGANQVVNVELYTSELRKYRDQARTLAMEAAAEKAQALAEAAGTGAGCVLSINENTWSYYNGWWHSSNRDLWTQNVVQNAPANGGAGYQNNDGPVSLGQISVRAEVSASFALE